MEQNMTEVREVWKDIPHYEGLYQVSNLGRIWSVRSQKVLRQSYTNGYLKVRLYGRNNKIKTELVHRLVGLAFLSNPKNYPQINHINERKDDNRVSNLEWTTCKENINYGTRTKRASKTKGKPISQYSADGKFVKSYSSITNAAVENGFNKGGICSCLRGRIATYKGYIWKYEKPEEVI